jgi:hypothetical protein
MPRATLSRHALFCLVVFAASSDATLAKDPWETIVGGRTDKPDGSSSITVGRKLESDLDAKVGADFNLSAPPTTDIRPGQSPFADRRDNSSGAAWANVTLPGPDVPLAWDKQTLDARVDPAQEQGKFGTTFSRSVPVGNGLSLTLEDGYAVTRARNTDAASNATTQSWETDKALRLKVAPVDTTLSVGTKMSGTDKQWLNSVGAEQKLFGSPVTVTGTISETTTGDLNRSIMGVFKREW